MGLMQQDRQLPVTGTVNCCCDLSEERQLIMVMLTAPSGDNADE